MDQLKQKLAAAAKHGFWIGTFVVAAVALGVWYMTVGSLNAASEKQISDLKAANASIDTIRSEVQKHPNELSHALMEQMVAKQNEAVLEAWRSQYERQQSILVWPEESLDKDFIRRVRPLFPIETHFSEFPVPPEKEIETRYLEAYRDYIGDVMESKAAIVGAEWTAKFNAPTRGGGGMGMMDSSMEEPVMSTDSYMSDSLGGGTARLGPVPEKGPLVQWKTASQEEVLQDLFPWRGSRPSTLEVLYSQENLWVLTQLLEIIAATNGNITQPFQAKIHEIEKIGIGRSAKRADGLISPVTVAGGGSTGGSQPGMGGDYMTMGTDAMASPDTSGGPAGMADYMSMDPTGGSGTGAVAIDPLASRYVDVNYQPIEATRVRAAMAPENRNPEDAFLTVAKRLPVFMRVKMDQREIPRLIAACGNAALMVEVRQIRINPTTKGGSGSSMAMSTGSSPDMGMSMDMGMDMGMDTGSAMSYGGAGSSAPRGGGSFPMDMSVEIYGIIQIYNPPAMEKLGVDQVDSSTVVEGQAMGEQAEAAAATATTAPPAAAAPEATVTEPTAPAAPTAPAPTAPAPTAPAAADPAAPAANATPAPATSPAPVPATAPDPAASDPAASDPAAAAP